MPRKTKYCDSFPDLLVDHLKDGNSYVSFAAKISVHVDTLYEWEKHYPEFSEAKKIGFTASQSYWEDMGKELARKNAAVYIFQMKNRFKWKDKVEESETKSEIKIYIDEIDAKL